MGRAVAVLYAMLVLALLGVSMWPDAPDAYGLLAVVLSLPWGLGAVLLIDTFEPVLVRTLGPPLVAMCGLLNAWLIFNALRAGESE